MADDGRLWYGTQYFRAPNPPRPQHRYHLERIRRELGFNLVKLFITWNSVEARPGRYEVSELDEIFDICDEIGLGVLVQTNLETAPYWLERAHPDGTEILRAAP